MTSEVLSPGPVFCLLLGVGSDYAQSITGQVTEVTCPVIGRAQPELSLRKRQIMGPNHQQEPYIYYINTFFGIFLLATWSDIYNEFCGKMGRYTKFTVYQYPDSMLFDLYHRQPSFSHMFWAEVYVKHNISIPSIPWDWWYDIISGTDRYFMD